MDASNSQVSIRPTSSQKLVLQPLSTQLYGIQWGKHFPYILTDSQIEVRYSRYAECIDFLKKHYSRLDDSNIYTFPSLPDGPEQNKSAYYQIAGDFFQFYYHSKLVGVFVGTPADWSTYYLRAMLLLPEHRERKIFQNFLKNFLNTLSQHSVYRVEGDVSSANLINIHLFNKLSFNITGQTVSERWGTLLRFTKFLNKENEKHFLNRFCSGIRPQLNQA